MGAEDILACIESHLADKITLEGTARHFLVSENTISQTFRQKMNVSFYCCVIQRWLIEVKTLIWGNPPLEQVAAQVGFADYSTFYRTFKSELGISPREYRKLMETQQ